MAERDWTGWDWSRLAVVCRREARRVLRDADDVDDAVQEALARAWRRRGSCRTPGDPGGWIRVIAHHEALRVLARRRPGPSLDETPALGEDAGSDRTDALDDRVAVRSALAQLPPQDRVLVHLRYGEDLTQPSIAGLLGLPEGTVKVRLHRIRARLMPALSDQ
jgi:RNA polymerase sigma-70 factor (ECF subfamily)